MLYKGGRISPFVGNSLHLRTCHHHLGEMLWNHNLPIKLWTLMTNYLYFWHHTWAYCRFAATFCRLFKHRSWKQTIARQGFCDSSRCSSNTTSMAPFSEFLPQTLQHLLVPELLDKENLNLSWSTASQEIPSNLHCSLLLRTQENMLCRLSK